LNEVSTSSEKNTCLQFNLANCLTMIIIIDYGKSNHYSEVGGDKIMKTFDFKSGTKVMVDEHQIVIERSGGKSAKHR
jgi:hypothetical protein